MISRLNLASCNDRRDALNGQDRLTYGHMQHNFQEAPTFAFYSICTILEFSVLCSVASRSDHPLSSSIHCSLSDVVIMGVFDVSARYVGCWHTGCGAG